MTGINFIVEFNTAYKSGNFNEDGLPSALFDHDTYYGECCAAKITDPEDVFDYWGCSRKNNHKGPHEVQWDDDKVVALWYTGSEQL